MTRHLTIRSYILLFLSFVSTAVLAQVDPIDSLLKYYKDYDLKKAIHWADQIDVEEVSRSDEDPMILAIMGTIYYYSQYKQKSDRSFELVMGPYLNGEMEKDSIYVSLLSLYAQAKLNKPRELAPLMYELRSLMPRYFDPYHPIYTIHHLFASNYFFRNSQYDSAKFYVEKAIQVSQVSQDLRFQLRYEVLMASLLSDTQQDVSLLGKDMIEQLKAAMKNYEMVEVEFSVNHIYALQLYDRLKYAESEKVFLNQMAAFEKAFKSQENLFYMTSALNLSNIYLHTSRYADAKVLIDKAINFFAQSEDYRERLVMAKGFLASYYRYMQETDKAIALHEETIREKIALPANPETIMVSKLNYARALIEKHKENPENFEVLSIADSVLIDATAEAREILNEDHSSYLTALDHRVTVFMFTNRWEEAFELNSELVERKRRKLGTRHNLYAHSLIKQAEILKGRGDIPRASSLYEEGMGVLLNYLLDYLPYADGDSKRAFWKEFDRELKEYLWFLVEKKQEINNVESLMARALVNSKSILFDFHSTRLFLDNNATKPELEKWLELREQLAGWYAAEQSQIEESEAFETLADEAEAIEKTLSIYLPENVVSDRGDLSEAMWQRLAKGEAYVEIFRLGQKTGTDSIYYIASILKEGRAFMHIYKDGVDLENGHLNRYRHDIENRRSVADSYGAFWKPLEPFLTDVSRVYINPDGVFNLISFPALQIGGANKFLADKYTVIMVGSTRSFVKPDKENAKSKKAMLVGVADNGDQPELTAVNEELLSAKNSLINKNWEVLLKRGAEAQVPSAAIMKGLDVWHFAGHAFLENRNYPMGISDAAFLRNGIYLAPREGVPNGKFTSYEIMNYDLRNLDLALLSACETGLGVIDNGMGVMSVRTAFSLAGARSVLMSLWKVDDDLSEVFMTKFYEIWLNTDDKVEAFKEAQLAVRQINDHPYYWGAFVLADQ